MRRRGVAIATVSLLFVAVPAALLVWMRLGTEDRLSELEPPPQPVVAAASEVVVDDQQAANLSVIWGESAEALAPAWSGTVTAQHATPRSTVESGDILLTIDVIDRIAAATPTPFFRSLGRNAVGDDVAQLQELLADLGHYEGTPSGTFDAATVAAVNGFAIDLGVVRPSGVFDPAWVVWLPEAPFEVARVETAVGSPAPAPGAPLLVGPSVIVSATATTSEGRAMVLEGEWLLEVEGETLEITDGVFDEEILAGLTEIADPGATDLFGRVRRAGVAPVVEVPAAAVTTNTAGDLCIWIPEGDGYAARAIVVDGGRIARVHITSGLEAGEQLLLNPNEVLSSPSCP